MKQPMLSGKLDLAKVRYPCWVSPKIDGIRAITKDYGLWTRKLKPIPNVHVQEVLRSLPEGLDGELIVGQLNDPDVYNRTQSAIMSKDGAPDFSFYVFDLWNIPTVPYYKRYEELHAIVPKFPEHVMLLPHFVVDDETFLLGYEAWCLSNGFEGVMVRDPEGRYKCGRSTTNEGILLKMKRYKDAEAVIVGMTEMMHNDNEATIDETGHTKRSHHKDRLRRAGVMGNLIVRDVKTGVEFEMGTGFTAEQRHDFWVNQHTYVGRIVTYKFFAHGVKDKPRHPVYKGFRDPRDM